MIRCSFSNFKTYVDLINILFSSSVYAYKTEDLDLSQYSTRVVMSKHYSVIKVSEESTFKGRFWNKFKWMKYAPYDQAK